MTLTVRARLTIYYSTVMVVVLLTGVVVTSLAQSRLALQRVDDDMARTMATLEGVMRTEFGEGLSLAAAAAEASAEVIAPDRALFLLRDDGSMLAAWGVPLDGAAVRTSSVGASTVTTSTGDVRLLRRLVVHEGHSYQAAVLAPLEAMHREQQESTWAMLLGVVVALLAAAAGGLLIARRTLDPLADMAEQAGRINERDPTGRLAAPHPDDELGQLASAFNALLERLAASLRQQRQFMADASHELRTPVSVVRTAAQVTLAHDVRTGEEYRESLQIVSEQATRLSRLVDAMFLLSRADAHGVPLRREFLNLDDIVAETARGMRVLAHQQSVTVTTGGDQEVGLSGDDALLRQMVGNLLDNAIRHAAPGSVVAADLARVDGVARLRITNAGPVIEAADRERIFERFARHGRGDGAGLGLPISRWIAEAHGGTVTLESSQPGRTTFTAAIPCDPVIGGSFGG